MRKAFELKHIVPRSSMIGGMTAKWGIGDGRSPIWDNNLVGRWDARTFPDGALATIPNTATLADKAPDLTVTGATMASGTLQFDGVGDFAETKGFLFPKRFTIFWDIDWLGKVNGNAGITHPEDLYLYNYAALGKLRCYIKNTLADGIPNTNVGISTAGEYYSKSGTATDFTGPIGEGAHVGGLSIGFNPHGDTFTQMGFRQLLIFNKELSQAEVNEVLRVMFPA